MKLKNPLAYGNWAFYIGDEEEIRIPAEGFVLTKKLMVEHIVATFDKLAQQGEPGYKERAMAEAQLLKISYREFISRILEHQICLRAQNKQICTSGGLGDKLHSFITKIEETVDASPAPIKAAGTAVIQKALKIVNRKEKKKAPTKARGCSACGGTKTFTAKGWNFGRVGRLNK